jgi:endoglucanase
MKNVPPQYRPVLVMSALLLLPAQFLSGAEKDGFHYNRLLGRGINLGNALEAPKEGEWGMTLKAAYFQKIKDAGFNSVRIPIRWSSHARDKLLK